MTILKNIVSSQMNLWPVCLSRR